MAKPETVAGAPLDEVVEVVRYAVEVGEYDDEAAALADLFPKVSKRLRAFAKAGPPLREDARGFPDHPIPDVAMTRGW